MQILAKSVGRRKEAVAQVQILRGTGQFIINNKPAQEYLQNDSCSLISVKAPFEILLMSTSKSTAGAAYPGGVSLPFSPSNPITPPPANPDGVIPASLGNKVDGKAGLVSSMVQGGIENGSMNKDSLNELSIDTIVKVKGGGLMGQAEAIRLGIARALCLLSSNEKNSTFLSPKVDSPLKSEPGVQTSVGTNSSEEKANPDQPLVGMSGETTIYSLDVRKQLKDKGYLTQDSRVKERRKYGLKKARKASQYHKR